MDLILVFVFFLSLVFLAIIFGERLSLFGFVDGRWLTAPVDMATFFWDMVCEAVDRVWCFVFDHFWWVAATVSGGIGIVLVALIMVTGLTEKAEADRRDEQSLMRVGSVLDHTAVLRADNVLLVNATFSRHPDTVDQLVHQVPSASRFLVSPAIRRRIVTDFGAPDRSVPAATDVPPLEMEWPTYPRDPVQSRSRLHISLESFLERQGHRVRSRALDDLIRNTVFSLRRDDWQTFSNAQALSRLTPDRPGLPEDSQFAVDDLYSRVRIIPGDTVSTHDLRVEKIAPDDAGTGEFDIEIRVSNRSRDTVSGLVVRELLPAAWQPRTMQPRGVYRDSTVTWLISELRPLQQEVLTLRVASPEFGNFQSYTEVSATAAVVAPSRVADPLPRAPAERSLPPVERLSDVERPPPVRRRPAEKRLPEVRLTLIEPPRVVDVGQWVDVVFQVRNVGNAPAEGVSLRVELPADLDHHDLDERDLNRRVDATLRTLQPRERREVKLTIRPTNRGTHFATAELRLQNAQLDVRTFDVTARQTTGDDPPIIPRPDFQ